MAKKESIDPRFSSAFGEYRPEAFRKQYGFINDLRLKEKQVIKTKANSCTYTSPTSGVYAFEVILIKLFKGFGRTIEKRAR